MYIHQLVLILSSHYVELLGILAALFCFYGMAQKNDRYLKFYIAIGFTLWAVHYSVIGGVAGLAAARTLVALRQIILLFWSPKTKPSKLVFASIFMTAACIVTTYWWSGLSSIIALCGLSWSSYMFTYLDGLQLRLGLILNNIVWFIGAAIAISYSGMLYQFISGVILVISVYKMMKQEGIFNLSLELPILYPNNTPALK